MLAPAILSTGPLANPPVPTATSGLNAFMIFLAFHKLIITLNGKLKFFNVKLRCKPLIHKPFIGYPASGTFSISILPLAPTKRISELGLIALIAFAIAIAGKICPPVPPPLIITLGDCELILF